MFKNYFEYIQHLIFQSWLHIGLYKKISYLGKIYNQSDNSKHKSF